MVGFWAGTAPAVVDILLQAAAAGSVSAAYLDKLHCIESFEVGMLLAAGVKDRLGKVVVVAEGIVLAAAELVVAAAGTVVVEPVDHFQVCPFVGAGNAGLADCSHK